MHIFRTIRCLFLNTFFLTYVYVAFCLAMVGCASAQSTTQEQKQRGQDQGQSQQQPPNQQAQDQDEEVQMGQEVFNDLKAKGEIIESSPLYDQLKPIADAITQAAQPRYNHPFKFYLVHETQPNAFATTFA